MIFSSQLGKLDGQSNEQALKTIANHLRKMQEELEYRLAHLDSGNINEIDTGETNIFANGENINNIIEDQDGNISRLTQTAEVIATRVEDNEGDISSLMQTAKGITTRVENTEGNISVLTQTVNGISSTVKDQSGDISELRQTASSLTSTLTNQQGDISTLQQTASSLSSTVQNQSGDISALKQTSSSLSASVSNLAAELSTTLALDASGVYITDQSGNVVTITGSQIDASTIRVSDLYGSTINLWSSEWVQFLQKYHYYVAGRFSVTGAQTDDFAVDLSSYGALRLTADYGDVFVGADRGNVTLSGATGNYSQGNFLPSSRGAYTCGSGTYPWSVVYATTGEINTSDKEKKNSIDYDTTEYGKLFDLLKPCSFKFNDGTSDRRHIGMIAQDVEEAMAAAGISSQDFAGFVKAPRKDEDEKVIEGEYDYFLRYGEFVGMCIAEIQRLKARVEELERKE